MTATLAPPETTSKADDLAPAAPQEVRAPAPARRRPRGFHPTAAAAPAAVAGALALVILLYTVVLGGVIERSHQTRQFDAFRGQLAAGTAPTGYLDSNGAALRNGAPVALLQIPALHLSDVVGEGTTPEVLTSGPGLYPAAPFPGQVGNTVVFGRQAAYGGPFADIGLLVRGDRIKVTTGVGVATYRVIDVRRVGSPLPPTLPSGAGRLTLVTDAGAAYFPSGVLRVDADLVGTPAAFTGVSALPLTASEGVNSNDTATIWALVLWIQALLLVVLGAVWSWYRWGRLQAWTVFLPIGLLVTYFVSDQITRLLPNLL